MIIIIKIQIANIHVIVTVIQGTSDINGKLSQEEVCKTVDFCFQAFKPVDEAEKRKVLQKLETVSVEQDTTTGSEPAPQKQTAKMLEANLNEDETRILNGIRARQMLKAEDTMNIQHVAADVIDGRRINLERGNLGLVEPSAGEQMKAAEDIMAKLIGEEEAQGVERPLDATKEAPTVSAH